MIRIRKSEEKESKIAQQVLYLKIIKLTSKTKLRQTTRAC